MMDGSRLDPLSELDWLEFFANQRGWGNMAQRIAEDVAKAQEREDELEDEMNKLRLERNSQGDESAA